MLTIRTSEASDIPAITTIYEFHVMHGTGTFETTAPTKEEMAARRDDVLSKGLPYLVLEDSNGILGFAYCNWFKPRPAYRFSAEDSIYMKPGCEGRGLGRLLLGELITRSERAGIRKLIAVIGDSGNSGSIGVHQSCGFSKVGVLSNCGWKFNRWLDVVLMEIEVGQGASSPPAD